MITKKFAALRHYITDETMANFIKYKAENGATKNMMSRYMCALKVLSDFFADDSCITKERLLAWRKSMEERGYASQTIINYVTYINHYLKFVGCSEICFNAGRTKDITGMEFGYLTAIKMIGSNARKNNVWLFQCKCGNTIELPATKVINGITLSCGCAKGLPFKEERKYFDGTSITASITERVESTRAVSGYVGVYPRRNKWGARIMYKGIIYDLGTYSKIEDAIKARARAKELVIEDAKGLLEAYTELQKTLPQRPSKTFTKKEFEKSYREVHSTPTSATLRSDNTSGYPGVARRDGKWEPRICYNKVRYSLGRFESLDDAVAVRKAAENLLKENPELFVEEYTKKYPHHYI